MHEFETSQSLARMFAPSPCQTPPKRNLAELCWLLFGMRTIWTARSHTHSIFCSSLPPRNAKMECKVSIVPCVWLQTCIGYWAIQEHTTSWVKSQKTGRLGAAFSPRSTPPCSMALNTWATHLVWSSLLWRTDATEPWWVSQLNSNVITWVASTSI